MERGFSLSGVAVRVLTVGYLPRKSEEEVESGVHSTTLITQGMYSTVRHPIALGNLLAWYGIILYVGVTWFIIGAAMLYTLFTYLVLMSEEEELKQRFGERYTDWARYTNALIPNRKLWVSNRYRFSLMQVIRREYVGFFCLVLAFVTINLIRNRVIEFTWGLSPLWSTVGAVAVHDLHPRHHQTDQQISPLSMTRVLLTATLAAGLLGFAPSAGHAGSGTGTRSGAATVTPPGLRIRQG